MVKYQFNPDTLTYEKVIYKGKALYKRVFRISFIFILFAFIINFTLYYLNGTPEIVMLKNQNKYLANKLSFINTDVNNYRNQLIEIQQRDDNLYRPIFEIEPVSQSIRMAGYGGSYNYSNMEGFENSGLVMDLSQNIEELSKQVYIQSKSYDQVIEKAIEKANFIESRPSIKPLSDDDYIRISDYFGWRKDPFNHKPTIHHGMDFAGPMGGEIVATGKGIVVAARHTLFGYGKVVIIDHGFGYKTKYAHLNKIIVKEGQKVNRGEVIGLLGNTGRSTGSHLHYEVLMNSRPVNPIYFFNNDISPEEYQKMREAYANK